MIKINLLPKEIEEKAAARKKSFIIAGIVVMVIAVFGGLYFVRVSKLSSVNGKIDKVEKELNQLESVVKKVNSIKKSKAQLDKKINVIKDLMESRLLYPLFMEDMAAIVPSGVWLKNLDTSTEDLSLQLSMGVNAIDNYATAKFINALEQSEKFSDIQFSGINTENNDEGKEVRQFDLTCRYDRAAEEEGQKED
ncbi:MAG: PilN domain-containing protein [Elusimicrobiota bacterium]